LRLIPVALIGLVSCWTAPVVAPPVAPVVVEPVVAPSHPTPPEPAQPTEVVAARVPVGCDQLVFDVFDGSVNGVSATASQADIKAKLPCATGDTADGSSFNVGGGVFFTNHDFYFYTHHDFIEVRTGFKGTTVPALLGASMADSIASLGGATFTSRSEVLISHAPGCISLSARNGKVSQVRAFVGSCDVGRIVAEDHNYTNWDGQPPSACGRAMRAVEKLASCKVSSASRAREQKTFDDAVGPWKADLPWHEIEDIGNRCEKVLAALESKYEKRCGWSTL